MEENRNMDYEKDILELIKSEFGSGLQGRELKKDSVLFTLGIIDSFGIVQLITGLEQRYGISFLAEDLVKDNLQSVESLARLVAKRKI